MTLAKTTKRATQVLCATVALVLGSTVASSAQGPIFSQAPNASITNIDKSTGLITAIDKSSGQWFQFKFANAAQLSSAQVGQAFFADFGNHVVSSDGKSVSGNITRFAPGFTSYKGGPGFGSIKSQIKGPAETTMKTESTMKNHKLTGPGLFNSTPNAVITNIDAAKGLITGKQLSTGQTFQFRLKNASQFSSAKLGQQFFVNVSSKAVSFNGQNVDGWLASGTSLKWQK